MKWILIYPAIINIIAFTVYGIDKRKAIRHHYRIPESTLILLALAGGTAGAWLGMQMFRHKTKKPKFRYGIPVIFVVQVLIIVFLLQFN